MSDIRTIFTDEKQGHEFKVTLELRNYYYKTGRCSCEVYCGYVDDEEVFSGIPTKAVHWASDVGYISDPTFNLEVEQNEWVFSYIVNLSRYVHTKCFSYSGIKVA